jgi:hypothetical protein
VKSELGRARHRDPAAWAVFRGCARKRRFANAAAAEEGARALGIRAYACRYCAGWHLTSLAQR